MSSSPFAVLDNRPIDKWKVTELKEELKRRRLTTRGLKDELVRRLDEALRLEQEESDRRNNAAAAAAEQANLVPQSGGNVTPDRNQTTETTPVVAEEVKTTPVTSFEQLLSTERTPVEAKAVETTSVASFEQLLSTERTPVEAKVVEREPNVVNAVDDVREVSFEKQVSEVIPERGNEVKSDCITNDSVSNNELKDNEKIADDVKLEQNVSSSQEGTNVVGESHPMDVEEPLEKKESVVVGGGGDESDAANADMTKGNNIVDHAGDSEKLNLDRDSGDESSDDEPETKQTVTSHEVVDKSENNDMVTDKEEIRGDGMDTGKAESAENKSHPVVASDKRKLPVNDNEGAVNNEPAKRQRRWNSESIKVPEAQAPNSVAPTITPRSAGLRRDFTRSDSSASEDGSKERVVPPSPKEPTNSLRIDRFLRPFTLKAVQELLGKTGNVTSFWMDQIKTHCYVSYSSVQEAAATREAVYNLQWPSNGGRLLVAEYVGPEEVKAKLEAPPITPVAPPPQAQPQPKPHASSRPPPTALPPPPPLAKLPPVIERLPLPPPPPLIPEDQEPPIVTLDDLFKKTKAIPRIYYLPLSEEQVAAKLAAQGNSNK